MKYIYDITKLQLGDIILTCNPTDEISNRVMKSTNSEFSHAMIYVGRSSCIGAENKVQARNLARILFDDVKNTCVLRIKDTFQTPDTITMAVSYARYVVGNPYSLYDALRLEKGITDFYTENTQICTRLVAKAFALSGLKIVDNVEMCTPQQLLESKYVNIYREFLRCANDFDLKFAESYDVTEDMVKATEKLFDSIKNIGNGKISSLSELTNYVINHKEVDKTVSELLEQSGYLDVINIEEERNKYNYDKNLFLDFYGENAYEAAIASLNDNLEGKSGYELEYNYLIYNFLNSGRDLHYLILMIDLYKRIIEQHERRIRVCHEVMIDPRS